MSEHPGFNVGDSRLIWNQNRLSLNQLCRAGHGGLFLLGYRELRRSVWGDGCEFQSGVKSGVEGLEDFAALHTDTEVFIAFVTGDGSGLYRRRAPTTS